MTRNGLMINAVSVIFILSVLVIANSKLAQAENIDVQNLAVDPSIINVGDTFSISGVMVNNSTNTISVHNGCGGPFTVTFDDHATVGMEKICNWMAIQIILKPGENTTLTSTASNLVYTATSPGIVNANVTLSYDVVNQSNPDLSKVDNVISKSLTFTVSDKSGQPEVGHALLSPLKQLKSGIDAKNIQCKDGLELIIKTKSNLPACVTPTTADKLVSQGWMKSQTDNSSRNDESSTKNITLEDNGKSINLKAGQSFLLKLGEDFEWNVTIDDQTVVSRALNIMVIRGAQGVYDAHSPGHATLTAVGDPPCLHSDPPCKVHSTLFTLDIEVTP